VYKPCELRGHPIRVILSQALVLLPIEKENTNEELSDENV
jgi:hypothetical protein